MISMNARKYLGRIRNEKYLFSTNADLSLSRINVPLVQQHLSLMKQTFDKTYTKSNTELYVHLRDLEEKYCQIPTTVKNYCSSIHKLSPINYRKDVNSLLSSNHGFKHVLSASLKCPTCQTSLDDNTAFNVHILNIPCQCEKCNTAITYQQLAVTQTQHRYNTNRSKVLGDISESLKYSFPDRIDGQHNTWKELFSKMKESNTLHNTSSNNIISDEHQLILHQIYRNYYDNLSSVSFDLIKGMYRQLDFVNKICVNYDYWINPTVITKSIDRYIKFMDLMKINGSRALVPTMDIDLVWHTHQVELSDTYLASTLKHCGREINHDDTIGSNNVNMNQAYAYTFNLWNTTYQESYSHILPEFKSWQSIHTNSITAYMSYGLHNVSNIVGNDSVIVDTKNADNTQQFIEEKYATIGTPVHDSTVRPVNTISPSFYHALECMHNTARGQHPQQLKNDDKNVETSQGGGSSGCSYGGCILSTPARSTVVGRSGGAGTTDAAMNPYDSYSSSESTVGGTLTATVSPSGATGEYTDSSMSDFHADFFGGDSGDAEGGDSGDGSGCGGCGGD